MLLLESFVGPGAASWLFLGRHGRAAAAKWGLGEWIHKSAPKAAREAPLAVGLCPVQHSCTGKSSGAVTGARMLGSS